MIGLPSAPCGGDGCADTERFGRAGEGFPRGFMRPAHGIPGRDAFPNPFNAPDPAGLRRAMPRLAGGRAAGLGGRVAAIDGRALRRSFAAAALRYPPHPVRSFAGRERPVSGQVRMEDKSNGIAAVPVLSGMPAPKVRGVTADAMRTRHRTARAVTAAGVDCVPAPKGNRGTPYEDVKPYPDDPARDGNRPCHRDLNGSRGRIGTRTAGVAHDIDRLRGPPPGPAAVGKVVAVRGTGAGTTTGTRRHIMGAELPRSGSGTRCAAVG